MVLSAPINLYAEYSLAWCNTAVILLLSLVFTIQALGSTVRKAAASAQLDIATMCEMVDTTATSLTNAPSALLYMLNNEAETSVLFALNSTRQGLLNAIDGVDALLTWFIDTYKSTYVCLLTLAVESSIDVVSDVANTFETAVQSILSGGINSVVNSVENTVFGNDTSQNSTVSWPNITSNWTYALNALDAKIHNWTLDSVISSVLSVPLQDLKTTVNQSLFNAMQTYNFTPSKRIQIIPVIPCNATDLQQDIQDVANKLLGVVGTLTYILIALMLAITLVNVGYRHVVNNWRNSMARSFVTTSDHLNHADAMLIFRAGHKPFMWYIMSLLGISPLRSSRSMSLTWLIDYVSEPAALFALAYGLSGLIFTTLAVNLINVIRNEAINAFYSSMINLVNNSFHNLSATLITVANSTVADTNFAIDTLEYSVNHDALSWINTTTAVLNSTLNQVSSDITGVVTDIFGGTVLENAAQGLVNCLILNKIQSIETGFTWLNNVSHIQLPRVSETVVTNAGLVPNMTITALLTPVIGNGMDHNTTLDRMLDQCISSLQEKLPFYWVLVSMWLFILFIGCCVCLCQNCIRTKQQAPSATRPSMWLYRRKGKSTTHASKPSPAKPLRILTKAMIRKSYHAKPYSRFSSSQSDDNHILMHEL
ncbi:hypothetical protein BC943DRAFT_378611 [Umbelopsis sp. AD052]|nr:hypothetical protein BC943DRAFT_378611 [Umbelopsis sp. AD052]